jgi:flagellum-specific peptidoglycan hydrolase FlgJ
MSASGVVQSEWVAAAQASHAKFFPRGPFVSVDLAQLILESAWGTRTSGKNNYFGIKATAAQIATGDATQVWTKEQRQNGQVYSIDAYFADYPTLEACFDAHAELLTSSHYVDCENAQTPEEYCLALHADGYATALNYSTTLMQLINEFDLKQYDTMLSLPAK